MDLQNKYFQYIELQKELAKSAEHELFKAIKPDEDTDISEGSAYIAGELVTVVYKDGFGNVYADTEGKTGWTISELNENEIIDLWASVCLQ